LNEGTERLKKEQVKPKSKLKPDSSEPYFYIALVLKGTENQYLSLLKYVNKSHGAQIIYQCKSLTYLRVVRDDPARLQLEIADPAKLEAQEG
jgi:hypothetical protein